MKLIQETQYDIYLAIDPGKNGSIVSYTTSTGVITIKPMPKTRLDTYALLEAICSNKKVCGIVEKVQGRITDAFQGRFLRLESLFRNHEIVIFALELLDVSYIMSPPKTWQAYFKDIQIEFDKRAQSLSKNKKKYLLNKHVLFLKACALFPNMKIAIKHADALLMLYYFIEKQKVVANVFNDVGKN